MKILISSVLILLASYSDLGYNNIYSYPEYKELVVADLSRIPKNAVGYVDYNTRTVFDYVIDKNKNKK